MRKSNSTETLIATGLRSFIPGVNRSFFPDDPCFSTLSALGPSLSPREASTHPYCYVQDRDIFHPPSLKLPQPISCLLLGGLKGGEPAGIGNARFDLIVMETTFNWRANISSLLSAEFLALARTRLNPQSILC
jgi:hypothetical protein